MEKASFARLNKLFKINVIEQAYNVLLSDKNMQALIENPKAFIILVFPRLVPPSLVPDEYFMLKDFHFYKVACLADSEAHQAYLEKREKKCQKETLRQAPATGRSLSSSTVRPSAYKKKIHVV